jgi:hypothetical protein
VLFAVTWDFIDSTEEGERRSLAVFQNWQPADGAEFKGFYGYPDNSGGLAIVEVDSYATLARITAPFIPWLHFEAKPIMPIEELAAIGGEAIAFRDSIAD